MAPAREPSRWSWSVGGQAVTTFGISPTAGAGGRLFVEATPSVGRWSPAARAGVLVNRSETTVASGAGATFWWALAMIEGCPTQVRLGEAVGISPCLIFHLGVVRGQGKHLDQVQGATQSWIDLGPSLRLRISLSARVAVEAQATLIFPLRRLVFEVEDSGARPTTVLSAARAGAQGGIGITYAFGDQTGGPRPSSAR